jgi:hypothetical protein
MRGMIQNAPLGVFVMMVLVPPAMAGVAVFAGLRARRQAQLMAATKPEPIGMATDGYRQFDGTAEAIGGQTIVAPLTGTACVWFSARVEEFKRIGGSGDRRSDWRVVRDLTSTAPMLVRDATGACVIRVHGAEVTPRDKSRWTGANLEPDDRNPPRLAMQDSWPMVESAGGSSDRFRYTETRIYAGDPLVVVGEFASHRFDAASADLDDEDDNDFEDIADGEVATESDEGDEDEDTESISRANRTWNAADSERHDTLDRLAASVTKAEIQAGGSGKPLILAASSAATHAYMSEMGAQAAFMIALVPLGLAALVLLARFS